MSWSACECRVAHLQVNVTLLPPSVLPNDRTKGVTSKCSQHHGNRTPPAMAAASEHASEKASERTAADYVGPASFGLLTAATSARVTPSVFRWHRRVSEKSGQHQSSRAACWFC